MGLGTKVEKQSKFKNIGYKMKKKKIKILISSVGSLVGQNILDALESPLLYRTVLLTALIISGVINVTKYQILQQMNFHQG